MKAILIIDMPSNCLDCPCEYDYMRCKATNYKLDYVNADAEKPLWCPLRPLPKKEEKPTKGEDDYNDFCIGYTRGWNDCIDTITGERNGKEKLL